jgi:glycosyltransferase involved in cell wall biosynthesis
MASTKKIPSVAVVYLARSADGSMKDCVPFAESYRKHPAGFSHDLVVIRKGGATKSGAKRALDILFEGSKFTTIDRSDDGFDIHAYLDAALKLKQDYVCFFNTFSSICADDWLAKLIQPLLDDPTCGIAGATASYESLYDSVASISKAIWLATGSGMQYDSRLAEVFGEELRLHAPNWGPDGLQQGIPRNLNDPELNLGFEKHWRAVTSTTGPLQRYGLYKEFPNPHLRSNGFIINRELLNSFKFKVGQNKIDCCQFESGISGLPTLLEERGLSQILVGADGRTFKVEDWPSSKTFRLEDQENILVRDNQVVVYDEATRERRKHISMLSWGTDRSAQVPNLLSEMGFEFRRANLKLTHARRNRKSIGGFPKFSIVIPTRNRVELVLEALHTIIRQPYREWECIVFDNCSDQPVKPFVDKLGDARIRVERSETFLPVTDSWNRAIDAARGDYVSLLGDDDGLSPSYLSSVSYMAVNHRPDFIYNSLYSFFHPGVAPWEPSGYVEALRYGRFFADEKDFFLLDPFSARQAVRGSLQFRRTFSFNMQAFCFEREFLDSIRKDGKVFHSPFPDYYLANVAFALGKQIMVASKPISVQGVSRKSFGFTLFNNEEKRGNALLATELEKDPYWGQIKDSVLPGPSYNTNYLITMHHVLERLGEFGCGDVAVERYRRLQMLSNIVSDREGPVLPGKELMSRLSNEERVWVEKTFRMASAAKTDVRAKFELEALKTETAMHDNSIPPRSQRLDIGSFATLPELYTAMEAGDIRAT